MKFIKILLIFTILIAIIFIILNIPVKKALKLDITNKSTVQNITGKETRVLCKITDTTGSFWEIVGIDNMLFEDDASINLTGNFPKKIGMSLFHGENIFIFDGKFTKTNGYLGFDVKTWNILSPVNRVGFFSNKNAICIYDYLDTTNLSEQ
jgi:hypothetical protein